MTELLRRAFLALGPGPTHRELRLVAETLRETADEETTAILVDAADAIGDDHAMDEVNEIAVEEGASAFVALDLVCCFVNPDFGPQKSGRASP